MWKSLIDGVMDAEEYFDDDMHIIIRDGAEASIIDTVYDNRESAQEVIN